MDMQNLSIALWNSLVMNRVFSDFGVSNASSKAEQVDIKISKFQPSTMVQVSSSALVSSEYSVVSSLVNNLTDLEVLIKSTANCY